MNWYNYVGNDPVNFIDPSGLLANDDIIVNGKRNPCSWLDGCSSITLQLGQSLGDLFGPRPSTPMDDPDGPDIVVNGVRPGKPKPAVGTKVLLPQRDPRRSRVVPLPKMMTDATNSALSAINQNPGGNSARDLNSGFSSLGSLPNFSGGGWVSRPSSHSSQAYEHSLPGSSGMSVKVYINDSENSGLNTVTITPPTYSALHVAEFPFYEAGAPVNTYNASKYLGDLHGC